jgi:hypothetical protein
LLWPLIVWLLQTRWLLLPWLPWLGPLLPLLLSQSWVLLLRLLLWLRHNC